jgi:hypothetical protein
VGPGAKGKRAGRASGRFGVADGGRHDRRTGPRHGAHASAHALLIGALVGIEREKRQSLEREPGVGGLRTFILIALVGAISGLRGLAEAVHAPGVLVAMSSSSEPGCSGGSCSAARVHLGLRSGLTTETARDRRVPPSVR